MRLPLFIAAVLVAACAGHDIAKRQADITNVIDDGEKRVVCYYTNWSVYRKGRAKYEPQNINPYLCTHLIYAFGGLTDEFEVTTFDDYQDITKGGYAKFNGMKQYNKGMKTLLALGGWNEGSARFSEMVAYPEYRLNFTKSAIRHLRRYNFDGLDLDWEYPAAREGSAPEDKENYATLVEELRAAFNEEGLKVKKRRLLLTMAVPAGQKYINQGYDVPRLNKHLDFINILAYDYHSTEEPNVNHHAPLLPEPGASEYEWNAQLNVDATVKYYIAKGADRGKLVVGIPTYGRSFTLLDGGFPELGASANGPGVKGNFTNEKGYLSFYEICEAVAVHGWEVRKPYPKRMGPFAFKGDQWVGYDDEHIAARKAEYVRDEKLGGIMFWSLDTDDFRGQCNGEQYTLIESAKRALFAFHDRDANEARSLQSNANKQNLEGQSRKPGRRRPGGRRGQGTTIHPLITPEPPTTPATVAGFNCRREGFYPNPDDCHKYFWCLSSGASGLGIVPHAFNCPTGLIFNKKINGCDNPSSSVKCARNVKKGPAQKLKTTTEIPTTTPFDHSVVDDYDYYYYYDDTAIEEPIEEDSKPVIKQEPKPVEEPKSPPTRNSAGSQFRRPSSSPVIESEPQPIRDRSRPQYSGIQRERTPATQEEPSRVSEGRERPQSNRPRRPQYVTIERDRPSSAVEDVSITDHAAPVDAILTGTTERTLEYVTLRRQRPSTEEPLLDSGDAGKISSTTSRSGLQYVTLSRSRDPIEETIDDVLLELDPDYYYSDLVNDTLPVEELEPTKKPQLRIPSTFIKSVVQRVTTEASVAEQPLQETIKEDPISNLIESRVEPEIIQPLPFDLETSDIVDTLEPEKDQSIIPRKPPVSRLIPLRTEPSTERLAPTSTEPPPPPRRRFPTRTLTPRPSRRQPPTSQNEPEVRRPLRRRPPPSRTEEQTAQEPRSRQRPRRPLNTVRRRPHPRERPNQRQRESRTTEEPTTETTSLSTARVEPPDTTTTPTLIVKDTDKARTDTLELNAEEKKSTLAEISKPEENVPVEDKTSPVSEGVAEKSPSRIDLFDIWTSTSEKPLSQDEKTKVDSEISVSLKANTFPPISNALILESPISSNSMLKHANVSVPAFRETSNQSQNTRHVPLVHLIINNTNIDINEPLNQTNSIHHYNKTHKDHNQLLEDFSLQTFDRNLLRVIDHEAYESEQREVFTKLADIEQAISILNNALSDLKQEVLSPLDEIEGVTTILTNQTESTQLELLTTSMPFVMVKENNTDVHRHTLEVQIQNSSSAISEYEHNIEQETSLKDTFDINDKFTEVTESENSINDHNRNKTLADFLPFIGSLRPLVKRPQTRIDNLNFVETVPATTTIKTVEKKKFNDTPAAFPKNTSSVTDLVNNSNLTENIDFDFTGILPNSKIFLPTISEDSVNSDNVKPDRLIRKVLIRKTPIKTKKILGMSVIASPIRIVVDDVDHGFVEGEAALPKLNKSSMIPVTEADFENFSDVTIIPEDIGDSPEDITDIPFVAFNETRLTSNSPPVTTIRSNELNSDSHVTTLPNNSNFEKEHLSTEGSSNLMYPDTLETLEFLSTTEQYETTIQYNVNIEDTTVVSDTFEKEETTTNFEDKISVQVTNVKSERIHENETTQNISVTDNMETHISPSSDLVFKSTEKVAFEESMTILNETTKDVDKKYTSSMVTTSPKSPNHSNTEFSLRSEKSPTLLDPQLLTLSQNKKNPGVTESVPKQSILKNTLRNVSSSSINRPIISGKLRKRIVVRNPNQITPRFVDQRGIPLFKHVKNLEYLDLENSVANNTIKNQLREKGQVLSPKRVTVAGTPQPVKSLNPTHRKKNGNSRFLPSIRILSFLKPTGEKPITSKSQEQTVIDTSIPKIMNDPLMNMKNISGNDRMLTQQSSKSKAQQENRTAVQSNSTYKHETETTEKSQTAKEKPQSKQTREISSIIQTPQVPLTPPSHSKTPNLLQISDQQLVDDNVQLTLHDNESSQNYFQAHSNLLNITHERLNGHVVRHTNQVNNISEYDYLLDYYDFNDATQNAFIFQFNTHESPDLITTLQNNDQTTPHAFTHSSVTSIMEKIPSGISLGSKPFHSVSKTATNSHAIHRSNHSASHDYKPVSISSENLNEIRDEVPAKKKSLPQELSDSRISNDSPSSFVDSDPESQSEVSTSQRSPVIAPLKPRPVEQPSERKLSTFSFSDILSSSILHTEGDQSVDAPATTSTTTTEIPSTTTTTRRPTTTRQRQFRLQTRPTTEKAPPTEQSTTRTPVPRPIHRFTSKPEAPTTTATTVRPRSSTVAKPKDVVEYDYVYDYYNDGALAGTLGQLAGLSKKAVLSSDGAVTCFDTGYFAHPSSCKMFISCSKTVRGAMKGWIYTCPQDLVFDPVGGMCNWTEDVDCLAK